MEFTSQQELYQKIQPAFNVKKRLIQNSEYKDITNQDIWQYLIETKWKTAQNLTISDIVNDIITLDLEKVNSQEI